MKLTKFSEKARSIRVSRANRRMMSVYHSQEYSNLRDTFKPLGHYQGWLPGVMYQYFKRLGTRGEKKDCHDALNGTKAWGMSEKCELNSKLQ